MNKVLKKLLLQQKESEVLEFKRSVNKDGIAKVLCSFLNSSGGKIAIGLSDSGELIGLKNAKKDSEELEAYLPSAIVPDAPVTISVNEIDGKEIITCNVWRGSRKPYIFDGGIYYRRGASTQKASSQEISELIHGRQLAELHWERQLAFGVDYEDLDENLINTTFEAYVRRHPESYVGENGMLEFLNELGLYQNGAFTNACVVLYAKSPSKFLPQVRVRFTEYANSKTDNHYIRDEVLDGNFFEIVKTLTSYCKNTGVKSHFSPTSWEREDYTFPSDALREGILNALIHRDYNDHSSSVSIGVYPGRIVISNSGNLPEGIKVGDLRKSHSSHPNNPDIAHVAFLHGFIEKLGRGTIKIIEECKAAGLKKLPMWKDTPTDVILTFYGPSFQAVDAPSARQLEILRLLSETAQISAPKLTKILATDVSARTIRTELKRLIESGWADTQGKARNLTYSITKSGSNLVK